MATINGTNGNDTLVGTSGDDTINLLRGYDVIDGGGGNDLLIVDYSSNTYAGGASLPPAGMNSSPGQYFSAYTNSWGNYDQISFSNIERFQITGTNFADSIHAGMGNDSINGGGGNDTIAGGGGFDTIDGGAGTDVLVDANLSTATNNLVITASGATITGNNGTTIRNVEWFANLIAGSGNDTINFDGAAFGETISGLGGDDTINAGRGYDVVDGGSGNDLLIVNYSSNTYAGGASLPPVGMNSSPGQYFSAYTNSSGSYDQVSFSNIERFQITGTNFADAIYAGVGSDSINGGGGNDTITDGGLGNDTFDGGAGTDVLIDTNLSAATNNLVIASGATITGNDGTTIRNIERFTNLIAGSGNDTINAGRNSIDVVNGGSGNDLLIVDYSSNTYAGGASLPPAGMNSSPGQYFSAYTNSSGSYDQVSFSNIERFQITGTNFADSIHAGVGNDSINGGSGNDTIAGGGGFDTIDGGAGTDALIDANLSTATNNLVITASGATITGNNGITIRNVEWFANLIAGSGNDSINFDGVAFGETISGLGGDDTINAGRGYDVVDGGSGNDLLIVNYSSNTYAGGASLPPVGMNSSPGQYFSAYTNSSGNYDQVNFSNIERFQITGTNFADSIHAGVGNDSINGGGGSDQMVGGLGNDTYVVNTVGDVVSETSTITTEIDTVYSSISYSLGANLENLILTGTAANATGNTRNNTMTGNASNNSLNGGIGSDRLIGGLGNDIYVVDNTGEWVSETSTITTEIDTVYSSVSYALGSNLENLFLTGAAVTGVGNSLNNTMTGSATYNSLNGGIGADRLIGGLGDDTYVVDNTGDVVSETSTITTEIDTVYSSISYSLGANLENLILTGTATNGTGNTRNNTITGNSGNNSLNGGTGLDRLTGGLGNDIYVVDNIGDVVSETSTITTEIDTVYSSIISYALGSNLENLFLAGNAVNGTGNTRNNTITGNGVANSLNGGAGTDHLIGGLGNDTYVVDNMGDVVSETSTITTEIDTVYSSLSYALGASLENLFLTGTAVTGIGNTRSNTMTGNASNNSLNGGTGADRLIGGLGNDTYVVDNTGDVVSETSTITTEIDTVYSSISHTLGANLENLFLTGTAFKGTGNIRNNTITGNTENNILNGGAGVDLLIGAGGNDTLMGEAGTDRLTGGVGNDFFRFNTRTEVIDTITDFSKVSGNADKIQVLASGFGGGLTVGTLAASRFVLGTSATNTTQRFIYNQSTGALFYDSDGLGGTSQTQFALLSNKPGLGASDIVVI